ncbi:MAG: PHP domain-containing protein [Anaerolineales bacterium]|nr:PHP domain-containing protein [Anaerolineales bacterium]
MTDGTSVEAAYAELHCHSYFSLLDGVSSPEALVARAVELGLTALALTDHDSLAGAVRFWLAARRAGLHAICGAEVPLADGRHLTLLAENQPGYANLCKLITVSRLDTLLAQWQPDAPDAAAPANSAALAVHWPGKTDPALRWERLAEHEAGLIVLTGCRRGVVAAPLLRGDIVAARQALGQLQEIFGGDRLLIELQHHNLPDDDRLLRGLLGLARETGLPVVATHNVHYATVAHSQLRDVLSAVRHNLSLVDAPRRSPAIERHLCPAGAGGDGAALCATTRCVG